MCCFQVVQHDLGFINTIMFLNISLYIDYLIKLLIIYLIDKLTFRFSAIPLSTRALFSASMYPEMYSIIKQ